MQSNVICYRLKFRSIKFQAWLRQFCRAKRAYKSYKKIGIRARGQRWMAIAGSHAAKKFGAAHPDDLRDYGMYDKAWDMFKRADENPDIFYLS